VTPTPRTVTGVVQDYHWGDTEFIPRLLGREPDGTPRAELWLGTHHNGPTKFDDGTPLSAVTGELPYLLKVLATAEPLSLQVHPTREQANDGHRRGGYPDANEKPELLCALTRFEAFCGVRPVEDTLHLLRHIGAHQLADAVEAGGPGAAMHALYLGDVDPATAIAACATSERDEAVWVRRLNHRYPGEASVAVTLLLNHVVLEPGEALHLTAGNLHAYLRGAGVELMGASDNVVRGGLTTKEVDIDELRRIVDVTPLEHPVMALAEPGRYPLPEAGCVLVHLTAGAAHVSTGQELAIAMDGQSSYLPPGCAYSPATDAYVVVHEPSLR
jgi:mannose-6-phosphate isomerase